MNTETKLIDQTTKKEIKIGDTIKDFDGKKYKLKRFYNKPAPSTGRVVVHSNFGAFKEESFYPSVFNLKIIEVKK